MGTTIHSEVGKIQRVLLRHARDAFVDAGKVGDEWQGLNYHSAPDFGAALDEYELLREIIEELGAEVVWARGSPALSIDSIYVRDAAILTDRGAVLCSMGKQERRAEPAAMRSVLEDAGIAVIGEIAGDGKLEGGDVCWMGPRALVVGESYRTNAAGIEQLRELLADQLDELVEVPLPHWRGPADVFHLMSIFSPVDHDAALVYSPLLPVRFRRWLLDRGFRLIEVPDAEFDAMACNVLALAPARVLMLEGNPETRKRLDAAGIACSTYGGAEISRKGEGGPTCLTRPLVRQE